MTDDELIAQLRRRADDTGNPLILRDLYAAAAGRLEDVARLQRRLEALQDIAAIMPGSVIQIVRSYHAAYDAPHVCDWTTCEAIKARTSLVGSVLHAVLQGVATRDSACALPYQPRRFAESKVEWATAAEVAREHDRTQDETADPVCRVCGKPESAHFGLLCLP